MRRRAPSAQRSGLGQVVDTAMIDGVMSLFSVYYGHGRVGGMHTERIGTNLFDGGAHFYNVYETSDHQLRYRWRRSSRTSMPCCLDRIGSGDEDLPAQHDRFVLCRPWKQRFAAVFRTKTRDPSGRRCSKAPTLVSPRVPLRRGPHPRAQRGRNAFRNRASDGNRQVVLLLPGSAVLRPSPAVIRYGADTHGRPF